MIGQAEQAIINKFHSIIKKMTTNHHYHNSQVVAEADEMRSYHGSLVLLCHESIKQVQDEDEILRIAEAFHELVGKCDEDMGGTCCLYLETAISALKKIPFKFYSYKDFSLLLKLYSLNLNVGQRYANYEDTYNNQLAAVFDLLLINPPIEFSKFKVDLAQEIHDLSFTIKSNADKFMADYGDNYQTQSRSIENLKKLAQLLTNVYPNGTELKFKYIDLTIKTAESVHNFYHYPENKIPFALTIIKQQLYFMRLGTEMKAVDHVDVMLGITIPRFKYLLKGSDDTHIQRISDYFNKITFFRIDENDNIARPKAFHELYHSILSIQAYDKKSIEIVTFFFLVMDMINIAIEYNATHQKRLLNGLSIDEFTKLYNRMSDHLAELEKNARTLSGFAYDGLILPVAIAHKWRDLEKKVASLESEVQELKKENTSLKRQLPASDKADGPEKKSRSEEGTYFFKMP